MFEAICQDIYGNSINGFTQWDINQEIFIKIKPCEKDHIEEDYLKIYPEVHFSNIKREKALVVKASSTLGNNIIQVKVPNILLTEPYPLLIYVYYTSSKDSSAQSTIVRTELPIRKRDEPHDYNYVENIERITAEQIKEEVEQDTEKTRTTAISEIGSHKDTALTEISNAEIASTDRIKEYVGDAEDIRDKTNIIYNEALEIVANARNEIKFIGLNPIKTPDDDTTENWKSFGTGFAYVNTKDYLIDQPATYGFIESYVYNNLVKQIWHSQGAMGSIYKRAGNADGWYSSWVKVLDENTGVLKDGDTMTGDLKIQKSNSSLRLLDADGNKAVTLQGISSNHRPAIYSYPTDSDENFEGYYFPVPNTGLTGSKSYYVLTSKSPVTVAQGGTGADNRVEALNNLGIYWGSEEPDVYWSKIDNGDVLKRNTIYIQIH